MPLGSLIFYCAFLLLTLSFPRCQPTSPCPVLPAHQPESPRPFLSDSEAGKQIKYIRTDGRFLVRGSWSSKTAALFSAASYTGETDPQGHLTKSKSISCLDNRLSIYKPQVQNNSCHESQGFWEQEEQQRDLSPEDGLNGRPLSWSTLSLDSSSSQSHKHTLSLICSVADVPPTTICKKISEWECRRLALPKMSLCLDKRVGERVGGGEGCPSVLSSPCSEKNFDFKGVHRMSTAFSECSYSEEEELVIDRDGVGRFQKRTSKAESSGMFVCSTSARKEKSAVLNRIQKIEQSLKDNPSLPPPRYLNNCYVPDTSKRSSICSVLTEPASVLVPDKLSKLRQRFSVRSARSESPEPLSLQTSVGTPVNPLPKPKRTFAYDAKGDQKGLLPANGLPPDRAFESPPPLPSTPAPSGTRTLKTEGRALQDR